jgi:vacuolar-type H+-ATPase subunit F/Vma7
VAAIWFIGDELTALGYRLAGARVVVPAADTVLESFEHALADGPVVLVAASSALRLPPERLERALSAPSPLTLVVPDADNRGRVPDLAARVRAALGVAT